MFGGELQGVTKNLAESRNEAKYTAQQLGLRGRSLDRLLRMLL